MIFDEQEKKYIEQNVLGNTVKDLTNMFNIKFKKNVMENQIRNYKKKNHLKSGVNTKFQKLTKPHNYKPVGAEFVNSNGYTLIKNEDGIWQLKHRYLYEKNFGKIPKGYSVIFANRNKNDFNIENLILVKGKEKLIIKNKHLIFEDKNLTETGIIISKLIIKNSEIEKKMIK